MDDVVAATSRPLERAPVGETLNVARGRTVRLSEVIETIGLVTGRPLEVERRRPGDRRRARHLGA